MKLHVGTVYSVLGLDCVGWRVAFTATCSEAEGTDSLFKAKFGNGVYIEGEIAEGEASQAEGVFVKDDGKTARWIVTEVKREVARPQG